MHLRRFTTRHEWIISVSVPLEVPLEPTFLLGTFASRTLRRRNKVSLKENPRKTLVDHERSSSLVRGTSLVLSLEPLTTGWLGT